jgi:toxin ParE1/3/4
VKRARLVIRPRAEADIDELAAFIARDSTAAALRFLNQVEGLFRLLSSAPGMGNPRRFRHPLLRGVRVMTVPRFPRHLVFYTAEGNRVDVIRVLHAGRDAERIMPDELRDGANGEPS